MRFSGPAILACLCLTIAVLAMGTTPAAAQTGNLQLPAKSTPEAPPKPPAAAPRQPVHQAAPAAAGGHTAPVVRPHGTPHPQKTAPSPAQKPAPAAKAPEPPPQAPAAAVPPAARPAEEEKKDAAGAKLPRFASLRSDEVNMRAGPGTRYPIQWVYKRRDLPVEIEREFEVWRLVRDNEGTRGWVHQATLTGRRTFLVKSAEATLRADAKDSAPAVAVLKVGVIGRIRSCAATSDWCQVQAGAYRGYLKREQIWGILPGEAIAP